VSTETAPTPRRARMIGDLYHGRIPTGAVYVGRPAPGLPGSPYANRHRAGDCRGCGQRHDRAGAVTAYAHDLAARPDLVAAARRDLTGADLACWCRLDSGPCHAEVLLLVAAGAEPVAAARQCCAAAAELPLSGLPAGGLP
jgi:hypothetical protein